MVKTASVQAMYTKKCGKGYGCRHHACSFTVPYFPPWYTVPAFEPSPPVHLYTFPMYSRLPRLPPATFGRRPVSSSQSAGLLLRNSCTRLRLTGMTRRELKTDTSRVAALKTMGPKRMTWSCSTLSLLYHIALETIVVKRSVMQQVRRWWWHKQRWQCSRRPSRGWIRQRLYDGNVIWVMEAEIVQ